MVVMTVRCPKVSTSMAFIPRPPRPGRVARRGGRRTAGQKERPAARPPRSCCRAFQAGPPTEPASGCGSATQAPRVHVVDATVEAEADERAAALERRVRSGAAHDRETADGARRGERIRRFDLDLERPRTVIAGQGLDEVEREDATSF